MKKYIIFAGVNGAGKTTLYQTNSKYRDLPRVNMDEIVRGFGMWQNNTDIMKAGKMAVKQIRKYFDEGKSFNQETTLCGYSIFNNIVRAKELGYRIEVYYVGLESADLAKTRVKQRVKAGGHGVSSQDIERRYEESIENLKKVIPICENVNVYDNTKSFRKIASFVNGECKDLADDIPRWFEKVLG